MTKQCINPSCLADNPDDAKFCRSCGYAFTTSYLRRISRFINKFNSSCDNNFFKYFLLSIVCAHTSQPLPSESTSYMPLS